MSTKSKSFDPLAHEAEVVAKVEEQRKARRELLASVDDTEDAMLDAQSAMYGAEASVKGGDQSVTPEALMLSRAAFEHASLRHEGVKARAAAAQRKPVPNSSKELAEALAPVVGKAFQGRIPTYATVALPDPNTIPVEALPVCYVAASKGVPSGRGFRENADAMRGGLSGGIDVMMVRDVMGRVLDPRHVADALDDAGFRHGGENAVQTEAGKAENVEVDRGRIDVTYAFNQTMPVIPKVDAKLAMAASVAGIGANGRQGSIDPSTRMFSGPLYSARDGQSTLVSEQYDGDLRTVTVAYTVDVKRTSKQADPSAGTALLNLLNRANLSNPKFAPGLGLVENIDVTSSGQNGDGSTTYTVTVTAQSRKGDQQ